MQADLELLKDGTTRFTNHGGARRGAGRPRKDGSRPGNMGGNEDLFADIDTDEQEDLLTRRDYESARARNELAKAQLNEISVRVQSGRYVARTAVAQSAATLLATLAQTLRSIPDSLERKGISPDICVMVEAVVNDALDGAASDLELLANDPL